MGHQTAITDSDVIDGLSIRYLKFFGIWKIINDYRTTGKKNIILKIQVLITVLFSIPSIICQYIGLLAIEVDIQKATILNLHSLPPLQALCKHLVFWFNIESLCRLYDLMRKDFLENSIHDIKKERAEFTYHKLSTFTNRTCLLVFSVITFGGSFLVFSPGISVDYILYHTGSMTAVTTGRKKISTGWYPLPMDTSPYYEIVVLYEGFFVPWCVTFVILFLCLYYQLLMCLNAQFTLLASHVSSLNIKYEYKKDSIECMLADHQIYSEMYRILQDHQKLLRFADELRSIYNPLVTMVLGIGTFILVAAVFQFLFGQAEDPMFIMRMFLYLLYQSTEVGIFCYGSSLIETASSNLHFAVYSSEWYKADIKFRKAAQMMMIRSKKGVTLTAVRMYPVNLETLMAILQFTYSISTLMSGLTE